MFNYLLGILVWVMWGFASVVACLLLAIPLTLFVLVLYWGTRVRSKNPYIR